MKIILEIEIEERLPVDKEQKELFKKNIVKDAEGLFPRTKGNMIARLSKIERIG